MRTTLLLLAGALALAPWGCSSQTSPNPPAKELSAQKISDDLSKPEPSAPFWKSSNRSRVINVRSKAATASA